MALTATRPAPVLWGRAAGASERANKMIQIGPGLVPQPGRGSATAPPPAPSLASLPVVPAARWHPQHSTVVETGGRVTLASDLMGLADAGGTASQGPRAMTDALGRRFWRFEGSEFLTVANALVYANTRQASTFLVGRVHRGGSTNRFFAAGSVAGGTNTANAGALLETWVAAQGAQCLGNSGDAANRWRVMTGAQMQVMGAVRRLTAQGGNRDILNRGSASTGGQASLGQSNLAGAEIGRMAFSPGAAGTWASFDLYELVAYTRGLTDAEGLAVSAALADHWAIPEIAHQLVLEGDSIMQGTGLVTGGLSAAMVLSDPGAGFLPANWRVINRGTSGNQVTNLVARRDVANGWPLALVPGGQNVLAFEIGRNDFVAGGQTVAQHHASVTAYLNTPGTGMLQRGWTVRQMANIARTNQAYRDLIRQPQYLTDTQTQPGGAFAGRLAIVSTDLIEDGPGNTVFLTDAEAADLAYYVGDSTHPTVLGARLRITGGTTPQHGVAWGL